MRCTCQTHEASTAGSGAPRGAETSCSAVPPCRAQGLHAATAPVPRLTDGFVDAVANRWPVGVVPSTRKLSRGRARRTEHVDATAGCLGGGGASRWAHITCGAHSIAHWVCGALFCAVVACQTRSRARHRCQARLRAVAPWGTLEPRASQAVVSRLAQLALRLRCFTVATGGVVSSLGQRRGGRTLRTKHGRRPALAHVVVCFLGLSRGPRCLGAHEAGVARQTLGGLEHASVRPKFPCWAWEPLALQAVVAALALHLDGPCAGAVATGCVVPRCGSNRRYCSCWAVVLRVATGGLCATRRACRAVTARGTLPTTCTGPHTTRSHG